MIEEGFSISFSTEPRQGGGVIIHGKLLHKGGHSQIYSLPLPADDSGGKNNIQGIGSAVSYGKRYLITMIFNIVTVGEDNDGNVPPNTIDDEQVKVLRELFQKTGTIEDVFCGHYGVANVEALPFKEFSKAFNLLITKQRKIEKELNNANPA